MKGNEDAKQVAQRIIKFLSQYGDEAIVAGGFARDYLLTKKYGERRGVKDIDSYVIYNEKLELEMLKRNFYPAYSYEDSNIKKCYSKLISLPNCMDFLVQVMMLNDCYKRPHDYVEDKFDLSICKVIFDGTNFIELPEFTETIINNEIYLNNNLNKKEMLIACKTHIKKISSRFPSYNKSYFNENFEGCPFGAVIIPRTKLSDKIVGKRWILRNEKFIYWKEIQEKLKTVDKYRNC